MPEVDLDRDSAYDAAQRELLKPIYPRQSPREQFTDFLEALLRHLIERTASVPGGWLTASALLLAAGAALLLGLRALRRTTPGGPGEQPLLADPALGAEEYRAAAESAAAEGDWASAIRDRLRAVAAELYRAGLVSPSPGGTATELARDAGVVAPELRASLADAARAFNDVAYGEQPGSAADYGTVVETDERVRSVIGRIAATADVWRRFR